MQPVDLIQIVYPPHVLETILLLAGAIMVLLIVAAVDLGQQR